MYDCCEIMLNYGLLVADVKEGMPLVKHEADLAIRGPKNRW